MPLQENALPLQNITKLNLLRINEILYLDSYEIAGTKAEAGGALNDRN